MSSHDPALAGPASLGPRALGAITYIPGDLVAQGTRLVFTATNCSITRDHVEIVCAMERGVGGRLQWVVTVAGQTSALPRTSYHPPVLDQVGLLLPNGSLTFEPRVVGAMSTAGGQTLVFTGDHFGPPSTATQGSLGIRAEGAQTSPSSGSGRVVTLACEVPASGAHTRVWCVSPPGVGVGFYWTLTVAGQASGRSSSTTSYARPVVSTVTVTGNGTYPEDPGAVPTAGGATVTLTGANFGADPALVALTWDGLSVRGLVLLSSHTTLVFQSPPGPGPSALLNLTVGGQSTWSLELGAGAGAGAGAGTAGSPAPTPTPTPMPLLVRYGVPRMTGLSLFRQGLDSGTSVMDCSVVGPEGLGPQGASGARALLAIDGVNFDNATAATVTVGGMPCTVQAAWTSGQRIVCATPVCLGACALDLVVLEGL